MKERRPTWQVDPCPAWCTGGHEESDHPDDRVHRAAPVAVPVVARRTGFEPGGVRRESEAAEFDVALSRVDGESQSWLYVGDGPGRYLEVTRESGERLLAAVAAMLELPA